MPRYIDFLRSGPARYVAEPGAWVLSRYDDVAAALREPEIVVGDVPDGGAAHRGIRQAVARSLSPERLAGWRSGFERSTRDLAVRLPGDEPGDLVAAYAAPLSLSLAATITGAAADDAGTLGDLARTIFLASARRTDGGVRNQAAEPAAELARRLPAADASMHVQTFVALSQTLPHLLAGVWLELFADDTATLRLRSDPRLMPRAVDELIRLAGPSRAIFRSATADVRIGDARIEKGDRVILMLAAANRDPSRFERPDRIDFEREGVAHLAFGGGPHSCAGARLTRMAVEVATEALLRSTSAVELAGPVEWLDGFAIRAPTTLPAVLRRQAPVT